MKRVLVLFVVTLLGLLLHGQPAWDSESIDGNEPEIITAPLYVFTNGPGNVYVRVEPFVRPFEFQSGEFFPVGSQFTLVGVPDPGCKFVNWSPVNIFVASTFFTNSDGTVATNSNVLPTAQKPIIHGPILDGRVQSWTNVEDGTLIQITAGVGWQANFAPSSP